MRLPGCRYRHFMSLFLLNRLRPSLFCRDSLHSSAGFRPSRRGKRFSGASPCLIANCGRRFGGAWRRLIAESGRRFGGAWWRLIAESRRRLGGAWWRLTSRVRCPPRGAGRGPIGKCWRLLFGARRELVAGGAGRWCGARWKRDGVLRWLWFVHGGWRRRPGSGLALNVHLAGRIVSQTVRRHIRRRNVYAASGGRHADVVARRIRLAKKRALPRGGLCGVVGRVFRHIFLQRSGYDLLRDYPWSLQRSRFAVPYQHWRLDPIIRRFKSQFPQRTISRLANAWQSPALDAMCTSRDVKARALCGRVTLLPAMLIDSGAGPFSAVVAGFIPWASHARPVCT